MALKNKDLSSTFDMMDGLGNQVKEIKKKERAADPEPKKPEPEPFKKPPGDYYRLDMVVRDTIKGRNNHPVTTEKILADYKDYVSTMAAAERISITKYIHRLIDEDMAKNSRKYKQLKRANKE